MSNIFLPAPDYSDNYLQTVKCHPFIDSLHEQLMENVRTNKVKLDFLDSSFTAADVTNEVTSPIFEKFKNTFRQRLEQSKLNSIRGFNKFKRADICLGVAHYMDTLHATQNVQVLQDEYRYHTLINPKLIPKTIDTLEPRKHLIISVPFARIGKVHPQMNEILNRCLELKIPVHIDGAWITACRNIDLDLTHPAIWSFSSSLSKGYGLAGWNRIGVRWSNVMYEDPITILNDYLQINTMCVAIGNYFLDNVPADHLWNTHEQHYNKICKDFNLSPTDAIHMATSGVKNLGLSPLLRYLESNNAKIS